MKETVRLNFEFPKEEYPYLKMLCAQKGVSFKEFATELLIRAIEEYEDEMLSHKALKRLKEMEEEDKIDWEEACRLADWESNDKKIHHQIQQKKHQRIRKNTSNLSKKH